MTYFNFGWVFTQGQGSDGYIQHLSGAGLPFSPVNEMAEQKPRYMWGRHAINDHGVVWCGGLVNIIPSETSSVSMHLE